jgi:hypothetical protein
MDLKTLVEVHCKPKTLISTPTDDPDRNLILPIDLIQAEPYMRCFPGDGDTLFEEPAAAAALVLSYYYSSQSPSDITHTDVERVAGYLHRWIEQLNTTGLAKTQPATSP